MATGVKRERRPTWRASVIEFLLGIARNVGDKIRGSISEHDFHTTNVLAFHHKIERRKRDCLWRMTRLNQN